jgi:hypothetical protein
MSSAAISSTLGSSALNIPRVVGVTNLDSSSGIGQYAESSFAGPEAVLAYLARYTHRVAIANSRLIALDERIAILRQPFA